MPKGVIAKGVTSIAATIAVSAALLSLRQAPLGKASDTRPRIRITDARISEFRHAALTHPDLNRRLRLASDYFNAGGSRGVADLIAGRLDRSIAGLSAAATDRATDPRLWNDLAAAHYERAVRNRSGEDFLLSLAAVRRALEIDAHYSDATFNRAVVLEALGLQKSARRAYLSYLEMDEGSEWANEAHRRLAGIGTTTVNDKWRPAVSRLESACLAGSAQGVGEIISTFPQQARNWGEGEYLARWGQSLITGDGKADRWLQVSRCIGDALVFSTGDHLLHDSVQLIERSGGSEAAQRQWAATYVSYCAARIAYRDRRLAESEEMFASTESEFRAAASPFELVSAFYRGCATYDRGDMPLALSLLDDVESRTPPEYRSLHAQIDYERSLVFGGMGHIHEALELNLRALREFRTLREDANASRAAISVSTLLVALGRPTDAWNMRTSLFRNVSRLGDASLLEGGLTAAAADEVFIGRWDTAAALYAEIAELPSASPRMRADALLWSAVAAHHSDAALSPNDILKPARAAAMKIRDGDLRGQALDDLQFAEAIMITSRDPRLAAEMLRAVIAYRLKEKMSGALPQAYVAHAEALNHMGDDTSASEELDRAIGILEQEPPADQFDLAERFFGTTGKAFDMAIELAASRGDAARVFDLAERSRRRAAISRKALLPLSLSACSSQISNDAVLLQLTTLARMTVAVAVRHDSFRMEILPVSKAEINAMASDLASAGENQDEVTFKQTVQRISDSIIRPLTADLRGTSIVVVAADDESARIPFAVLSDLPDRSLIESHAIVLTPSATAYFRSPKSGRPIPNTAAVVGNPTFNTGRFPNLEGLPGAMEEATAVANIYGTHALVNEQASKQQVLAAFQNADIIHIAAHTVADAYDPLLSVIPLADDGREEGLLYLRDVMALSLDRAPIVVLAGCRTAAARSAGRPIHTFALAFQVAGARAVLGSLWNLNDDMTRPLVVAFHRNLRAGLTPVAALREAQLKMSRSPLATERRSSQWGAFQIYANH